MTAVFKMFELVDVNLSARAHYTLRYRAGKLSNCF